MNEQKRDNKKWCGGGEKRAKKMRCERDRIKGKKCEKSKIKMQVRMIGR